MQTKDLKVGSDYVLSGYGGIARVRVVETGIKRMKWSNAKADGVHIEFVDQADWYSPSTLVASRDIVRPWDEAAQATLDKRRAAIATGERVEREGNELGVVAALGGSQVRISLEDWDKLVARLRSSREIGDLGIHIPERDETLAELHKCNPFAGYDNPARWATVPIAKLRETLDKYHSSSAKG